MSDNDATTRRLVGGGVAGGIAAWALGYLATHLLAAAEIENWVGSDVLDYLAGEDVTWKLVGWLFYNAHNVAIRVPGLFGESARNFVAGADDPALTALFALPPVLLAAAGAATAWNTAAAPTTAARNGAAVVLGYLPLSILGSVLFTVSVGDASASPAPVTAALLAGVVYPAVFGAVGGLAGGHVSSE